MRSGWCVLSAFVALWGAALLTVLALLALLPELVLRPERSPLFAAALGALAAGWVGMGAAAGVMLLRGAGRSYGHRLERGALEVLAALGLLPALFVVTFVASSGAR